MPAGKYRDVITIEERDEGTADSGGHIDRTDSDNWSTFAIRRAEVIASTGREFVSGEKVQSEVSYVVKMRWDSTTKNITPLMRIVVGSKTLQIVLAYEVGNKNREVVCQCKETG